MNTHLPHQLDFSSFFRTANADPIKFATRRPPNLWHDLLYLSSYLHDGEFRMGLIQLKGKTLQIPMERSRWELDAGIGDLAVIPSVLAIKPVLSVSWEWRRPRGFSPDGKFIISWLYPSESFWDNHGRVGEGEIIGEIVLVDPWRSKLRLQVGEDLSFRLTDLPGKPRSQT